MIDYKKNIILSGLTIYNEATLYDKTLYIPDKILEALLNQGLAGLSLTGLPFFTNKIKIC
jgi:hypothetical protein